MTVKFDDDEKQIEITPYSKNETYVYTGDDDDVEFTIEKGNWDASFYSDNHRSFATMAANEKDLVITTLFYDNIKYTPKLVTTTIKDFYGQNSKYAKATIPNGDANLTESQDISTDPDDVNLYKQKALTENKDFVLALADENITLNTAGGDTVYNKKGVNEYTMSFDNYDNGYTAQDAIYDFDGNDTYTALNDSNTEVDDFKGKDSYKVSGDELNDRIYTKLVTYDYDGNDKYEADRHGELDATDYKGNDEYNVSYAAKGYITDYAGMDSYTFEKNAAATVTDFKGNDKYNVLGNDTISFASGDVQIVDTDGADTYTFDTVTTDRDGSFNFVEDQSEKSGDTYIINKTKSFEFTDDGGNDKWTVTNCSLIANGDRKDNLGIWDKKGNDVWTLSNVQYNAYRNTAAVMDDEGNDKYTLSGVKYLNVQDGAGQDKYTVENSNYVQIDDALGVDTYNLKKGAKNVVISDNDEKSKDKYVLSGEDGQDNDISGVGLNDLSLVSDDSYTLNYVNNTTISDAGGKNSFKVTNSSEIAINAQNDYKADDKYDIGVGSSEITINDMGGKDTYNIKGTFNKNQYQPDWVEGVYITDNSPGVEGYVENDTYNFQYVSSGNSMSSIYDGDGNEKYNFANVEGLSVEDAFGSDKYQITGSSAEITITDEEGKDNYTIKGTKAEYLDEITVTDKGTAILNDADTYNLDYTANIEITDNGGNNTFNIKNSLGVMIATKGLDNDEDSWSLNKYNLTSVAEFDVVDGTIDEVDGSTGIYNIQASAGEIQDYYGDDTYNITKMKKYIPEVAEGDWASITDKKGNDSYKVDKLTGIVEISDTDGNDTLTIGGSQKDFVFMTNCTDIIDPASMGKDINASLIAYDRKNGGYVMIHGFFTQEGCNYTNIQGEGRIEEIKIGKAIGDDKFTAVMTDYNTDALRAGVAAWLNNKGYDDIQEVLEEGTAADIAKIVAVFTDHSAAGLAQA